jgi:hypothetical protein
MKKLYENFNVLMELALPKQNVQGKVRRFYCIAYARLSRHITNVIVERVGLRYYVNYTQNLKLNFLKPSGYYIYRLL